MEHDLAQLSMDKELHARVTDPPESEKAGMAVQEREGTTATFRPRTQKHRILAVYGRWGSSTDAEAWMKAGINARSGAWHRCSDLLAAGAIAKVDTVRDRETDKDVRVCAITDLGRKVLEQLDRGETVRL